MDKKIGIWTAEGNNIYLFKDNGERKLTPTPVNDYRINVEVQNRTIKTGAAGCFTDEAMNIKQDLLAKHIAILLNRFPIGSVF